MEEAKAGLQEATVTIQGRGLPLRQMVNDEHKLWAQIQTLSAEQKLVAQQPYTNEAEAKEIMVALILATDFLLSMALKDEAGIIPFLKDEERHLIIDTQDRLNFIPVGAKLMKKQIDQLVCAVLYPHLKEG